MLSNKPNLALMLLQFGISIDLSGILFRNVPVSEVQANILPIAWVMLSALAISDALITAFILYYLIIKDRALAKSNSLKSWIHRIAYKAVQSNALQLAVSQGLYCLPVLQPARCITYR